jgi:hypothetical protein
MGLSGWQSGLSGGELPEGTLGGNTPNTNPALALLPILALVALSLLFPESLIVDALSSLGFDVAGDAASTYVPLWVDDILYDPMEYEQHTIDWVTRTFPDYVSKFYK